MDDRFPTIDPRSGAAFRTAPAASFGDPAGSLKRIALAAAIALSGSAAAVAQGPSPFLPHGSLAPHRSIGQPQRLPTTGAVTSTPTVMSTPPETSTPPVTSTGLGERLPGRQRVAKPASRERLQRSSSGERRTPPAPLVESMTVLRLHRRSEQLTLDAELALRRGAIRSARASILEALRTSAAAADLQSGQREATQTLEQAITAVREAGDLVGRYGHVGTAELQRMVQSHRTPVLHGCRVDTLTSYAAVDIYLDFARASFTRAAAAAPTAAARHEAATMLLWLARTELAHRELHGELAESVSLTCLRAAVGVDPNHALASNELGYRAMRLGLLEEAQWALERSLELQPSESALQNLIETHRLAGNSQAAQMLVAMLPSQGGSSLSPGPAVLQVAPSQFAAISPPVQPPAATAAGSPPSQQPPLAPTGTETGEESESREAQPAADGTYSVLERVADSMRSLWK